VVLAACPFSEAQAETHAQGRWQGRVGRRGLSRVVTPPAARPDWTYLPGSDWPVRAEHVSRLGGALTNPSESMLPCFATSSQHPRGELAALQVAFASRGAPSQSSCLFLASALRNTSGCLCGSRSDAMVSTHSRSNLGHPTAAARRSAAAPTAKRAGCSSGRGSGREGSKTSNTRPTEQPARA